MNSFWLLGCCGALLVVGAGLGRHHIFPTAGPGALSGAIAQTTQTTDPALQSTQPSNQDILADLVQADVIYLGETHTDEADHIAQLDIITAMHQARGDIAIGLEMFQRPFQSVLDQYIAGEITEADLVEQSEYETRWGFDWELYAPIIRYAQANQIPLIALNTPREITKKVAREGLTSLTGPDLEHIPPLTDIDTSNENYQAMLAQVFSQHGGHGNSGPSFENFFAAQVLWDETMAASVADFVTDAPNTQVLVMAGEGHIVYGFGIPSRVERRLGDDLVAYSVLLNPTSTAPELADFFWFSESIESEATE
ncbi:ChaN family lipoprotein [Leptolyngbya cf. ectocarpi LEGE 11479]|uniref:ChaN family lipoprotein n=1 Tax=Leptolyngbya cf. ectocarpi LEGE 11479 TaxID=1828722 RepID=A0A929A0M9_LEPEC|nr:ChaN family lipoprotein [Leptolyngbya ectocarpi]MBE9070858.1 ChaN family lipoprotein [Leptolyngbya cf. ectocarpi LEGE 11479]